MIFYDLPPQVEHVQYVNEMKNIDDVFIAACPCGSCPPGNDCGPKTNK